MNKLIKLCLALGLIVSAVLSGCSRSGKEQPDKVSGEPVFTFASGNENRYTGKEVQVKGLFNGKDIGVVGTINSQGELNLNLPAEIPDDMLGSRPGTDIKGGGLTTIPDIRLWKNETDFLLLVYVNRDYEENGTAYKRGWNYATNKHQKANSTEGYKWVLMEKALNQ